MVPRIIPAVIFSLIITSVACRKDKGNTAPDCQQLKTAIATGDKDAVIEVVNDLINQLPDRKHNSRANLETLVASMNQQCQVTTKLLCWACIYTIPPQSEISVSANHNGSTIYRVVDISNDKDGNMIAINMHD